MQRYVWFSVQIAIIAFFVWVDWGVSHSGDPRAMPGFATILGILIAFGITFFVSNMIDMHKGASFIARRTSPATPPPFPDDVAETVEHGDKLNAVRREPRELPKYL